MNQEACSFPNDANTRDQAQAYLLSKEVACFDDLSQGPIVSCFGRLHEDSYNLWTCKGPSV